MLNIENITFSYPKSASPALSGLSASLQKGAVYGLLGSNGSGKSTLLYLMCGLLRPKSGIVTFNGTEVWRRKPSVLSETFLVPEEVVLPPVYLSEFVKVNAPFYPRFSREDMERYLTHFHLDSDIHLGRLSMGQRKKAFIAFALACNTSLLLMDEPTNGLDIPGKSEFRRALISAMTDERTVVISTHQVRDLDRVLDHLVLIDHSRTLINCSMALIQQRMAFRVHDTALPLSDTVLYCGGVPGGYATIEVNGSGAETDVNLESLFEFTLSNPETVKNLLK